MKTFYSPFLRLAADRIQACALSKDGNQGFIHAFKVIKDIPNIYKQSPSDIDIETSIDQLNDRFCYGGQQYYGVAFFYPKNAISEFNPGITDNHEYKEFGLCNAQPYLEYLHTYSCIGIRQLSKEQKNSN